MNKNKENLEKISIELFEKLNSQLNDEGKKLLVMYGMIMYKLYSNSK
jgi:hypothetical protein